MWSPPCLLLLFQALEPSLAISFQGLSEHQQTQEDRVFLDDSAAHKFLGRKLLYNYWDFELVVPDNLERECREEVCNYEEAREVFEDDKKTAENSFGRPMNTMGKEEQVVDPGRISGRHITKLDTVVNTTLPPISLTSTETSGVDVAGLVAGLIGAMVSAVMFVIVATYCFKYRAKRRNQSRTQDNLYPLANFDEEPKPESAPGLPSYEQAMASSGVHDAPPPPYDRNSTNSAPPT